MTKNRKKILLKDESKLLFFAWELLQRLTNSQYFVYLDKRDGYGNYLSYFPNLKKPQNGDQFDLIINFTADYPGVEKSAELNYFVEQDENDNFSKQQGVDDFFDILDSHFSLKDYNHKKILITAGPTAEDIDPVRFLTNRSTGKMGVAIARAAFIRGAKVKLVMGPGSAKTPSYLNIIKVRSAEEMNLAIQKHFSWCDCFIASSAVADYTPITKFENKMKKGTGNLSLEMKRTKDILHEIQSVKRKNQIVIGFSVETKDLIENSRKKLIRKKLDLIVANNPNLKGAGFAVDTNQVELITQSNHIALPLLTKKETADKILDYILENNINE